MPYWEDTSSAKVVKTRCIFINFDGGEKTNLPALVRARSYARFHDPNPTLYTPSFTASSEPQSLS
jgi:hypothetical protein